MKLPELVFRTTTPAALEWFQRLDEQNRAQQELRAAFVAEMTELYGPAQREEGYPPVPVKARELWLRGRGGGAYALDSGRSEEPPKDSGWRLDSKDRNWQPKLATKQGKVWRDRLAELNQFNFLSHLPEVGIPEVIFLDLHMYGPSLEQDPETGALYNGWSTQHITEELARAREKATIEVEWEQMKLSEYVAYLEAKEEKNASEAES